MKHHNRIHLCFIVAVVGFLLLCSINTAQSDEIDKKAAKQFRSLVNEQQALPKKQSERYDMFQMKAAEVSSKNLTNDPTTAMLRNETNTTTTTRPRSRSTTGQVVTDVGPGGAATEELIIGWWNEVSIGGMTRRRVTAILTCVLLFILDVILYCSISRRK